MATNPHISIVVPVYKAENCLQELYARLKKVLEPINPNFEILFVEDCGGDRSWKMIESFSKTDSRVKGLQFSRNFGQHYGITAGLDHCTGDWVVVMDCDLQDPPEEIARLYAKAKEGFEIVIARRMDSKQPLFKRLSSRVFYGIFGYLADLRYDHRVGNFRILSRKVVNKFSLFREELRFFGALINWMGFSTAYVDIEHAARFEGKSAYTYRKLFNLGLETILAYSDKPLKLAVKIGFMVTLFSFAFGLYVLYRALFQGIPVSGWASLIVSLYFLGGMTIAILGVVGVYLGKTFDQTKGRPLYLIDKATANINEKNP
ncbi:MAG: glycosyltransferase family 2 protein [Bdellovibrionota bacterium]